MDESADPSENRGIVHLVEQIEAADMNITTDPATLREQMKEVAERNKRMKVPARVRNIMVFSSADRIIAGPKSKRDAIEDYGPPSPNKLIIRDKSKPEDDDSPHSMLWIDPQNLIKAVKMTISSKHARYIEVGEARRPRQGAEGEPITLPPGFLGEELP